MLPWCRRLPSVDAMWFLVVVALVILVTMFWLCLCSGCGCRGDFDFAGGLDLGAIDSGDVQVTGLYYSR